MILYASHFAFFSFAAFFLFVNLGVAMMNEGVAINDFNRFGEMRAEVMLLSVLLVLSMGHLIIESKDRRRTVIMGVISGVALVGLAIGMYLLGMMR